MKTVIAFALILFGALLAGIAFAGTSFTYQPATDGSYVCGTYCAGFVTSDPAHTVEYVNVQYAGSPGFRITASVDGQSYTGYAPDPRQLNQLTQVSIINGVVVYGSKTVQLSANYWTKRTCTVSGRAQHCTTWYFTTNGEVSTP